MYTTLVMNRVRLISVIGSNFIGLRTGALRKRLRKSWGAKIYFSSIISPVHIPNISYSYFIFYKGSFLIWSEIRSNWYIWNILIISDSTKNSVRYWVKIRITQNPKFVYVDGSQWLLLPPPLHVDKLRQMVKSLSPRLYMHSGVAKVLGHMALYETKLP